jgi:hypothetical protein
MGLAGRMADVTPPQGRRGQGQQRGGGAGANSARGGGAGASSARGGANGARGGARARGARPLPRGDSLYTPGAGQARSRMERSSARPLVLLHQLPRWVVPILAAGLLVVGLAVPGWAGAAALVLVAAFLGWLAALSWPALNANGRLLRLAAVAGVLVLAVIRAIR